MATEKKEIKLYNDEVSIIFYPNSHRYKLEGEKGWLIGVTSVSGIVDKSRILMAWVANLAHETGNAYEYRKKQDKALSVGSIVHDWIESYSAGEKRDLPEDENAQNGIMSFLDWVSSNKVEFLESEKIVYSKQYGYVGTLDAIALVNGELCLIDYKTSKDIYTTETRLQTAGYQLAFEEEIGEKIQKRIIVNLNKDTANLKIAEYENCEEDSRAFLSALNLKQFAKKHT